MPPRRDLMRAAAAQAPLGATSPTLANGGLRLVPANQVSKRRPEYLKVNVRVFLSIRFRDAKSNLPASSTNVVTRFTNSVGVTTEVPMAVDSQEIGHYTGSFVFTAPGDWSAAVMHGSPLEMADTQRCYVTA